MIKNRVLSYDYLRAISIIMIILCHMNLGFGISRSIGGFLGGTFVDVFFLLSATLLGIKTNHIILNPRNYLAKRFIRILPTYYTYLFIVWIGICVFLGISQLSIQQVLGHVLFLNWFWESSRITSYPLPHLGHLWFMSCIMVGYLTICVWSIIRLKFNIPLNNAAWLLFSIFSVGLSVVLVSYNSSFSQFCLATLFFIIFFNKGSKIVEWFNSFHIVLSLSVFVLSNLITLYVYISNFYLSLPSAVVFLLNFFNATIWIAYSNTLFPRNHINRVVEFLSAISFEIYLVHHPFCMGILSLTNFFPQWIALILVWFISILGGWFLSRLVRTVKNFYSHIGDLINVRY